MYVPQLFESDRDLDSIGRLRRVERDIRLLRRHDCCIMDCRIVKLYVLDYLRKCIPARITGVLYSFGFRACHQVGFSEGQL